VLSGLTALLALVFFVVAAAFSMLGQGGGALYTPVQVFFGIRFHTAATTSLFLIMVTSLSATLVYRRAGRVDWGLALALEAATALGGLTGGLVSDRFSGTFLSLLFAGFIAFAATFMVRDARPRPGTAPATLWCWGLSPSSGFDYHKSSRIQVYKFTLP
jgi:uncharacterized membrane protein YfcA